MQAVLMKKREAIEERVRRWNLLYYIIVFNPGTTLHNFIGRKKIWRHYIQ
jgi:hypothetical protein